MRASGAFRCIRRTYLPRASVPAIAGTWPSVEDAARERRVQDLVEGVDGVRGRELLAVVELDALAQVEVDRLRVDARRSPSRAPA